MKKYLVVLALISGLFASVALGETGVHEATIAEDGVQRVEILGGSYFFKPRHIVVKVNVPVELIVKKESGITPHNIALRAPDAGIDFEESLGKEPKVIRFTPTKTGKYPFYCGKKLLFFESHREKGMEGMLEVTE